MSWNKILRKKKKEKTEKSEEEKRRAETWIINVTNDREEIAKCRRQQPENRREPRFTQKSRYTR